MGILAQESGGVRVRTYVCENMTCTTVLDAVLWKTGQMR